MTIPELIHSFINEEIRIRIMDADNELQVSAFWKTDYSSLSPKWSNSSDKVLEGSGTTEDPYIVRPNNDNDESHFQYPELHKYDDAILVFWDIVNNGNTIEIYIDFEDSVKHDNND